ncbi:hypothetical protein ZEAMMB73_Zm00001d020088 [Zea mays]|uniref:Uncharacterized protein n=1 Tax=Zea mays TaxID=4577 RepID=A0A1D6I1Z7_MAIZE|nr:hypothetical protein ZEAMMB73_Zm00001d020088 [Zea mays]ONM54222.1 hypothetical protein ZEAMMB73_Zm00001d020088 [Zea mays]ONM54228.1 hypothetical protein ZEAMMB73_Zm00001d020088 [Zea mays]
MTKEEEDEEYLEEEEDALAGAGGNTFSFTTFMLLTPLILVRGRLDSDGEVTSEVDQVRALQEEVVIQDDFGFKLKEEAMLNKVLKETVLSKVVAIDKLQSGLASSLRIQDVMRNEIQRVQDELSCITHKAKQLELQDF